MEAQAYYKGRGLSNAISGCRGGGEIIYFVLYFLFYY